MPNHYTLKVDRVETFQFVKLTMVISILVNLVGLATLAGIWLFMDASGIFAQIDDLAVKVVGEGSLQPSNYLGFSQVLGLAGLASITLQTLVLTFAVSVAIIFNQVTKLFGGLAVRVK